MGRVLREYDDGIEAELADDGMRPTEYKGRAFTTLRRNWFKGEYEIIPEAEAERLIAEFRKARTT